MKNTILLKILLPAALLTILDLATKALATAHLQTPLVLIPNIFTLAYHENTGIAWSLPVPQLALLIVTPLLIIAGALFLKKEAKITHPATQTTAALLLSGALGNYIDRLTLGYVVDFISIGWWPVFNIADMAITAGFFILIVFYGKIFR